jgi:soluble cytochrome b562
MQQSNMPEFMKAQFTDAEKRMNMPLSELMAEKKAAYAAEGIADISEGQQKQRAELMAEKANMGEEKERQKHLRLAEFFAKWGTTPGPVLVAGMNALRESVPGIISDEKEAKKARREIDKSIADLDNATRLEKRGEVDAAMAIKLKAAEDMKALQAKFVDYQSRRESDASSAAASKYSADMQYASEKLRAQTSALDRAANRETAKDSKAFGQWQAAAKTEGDVLARIQREENDKQHMDDLKAVKLGKQTGMDEDNKFDETKVPAAVLSAMKEAQTRITEREKSWKERIRTASQNTDIAYSRVSVRPEVATKDYTKPTGNAAPAAAPNSGPISGDFQAPTAAHIAALKQNPRQAEAFDAKFGPGAANEYLGK